MYFRMNFMNSLFSSKTLYVIIKSLITYLSTIDPVLIDTSMAVMNIQWNNCGSVLAVAGMQRAAGQVNEQTISDNCNIHSNATNYVFEVLIKPGQTIATLQHNTLQHS